MEIDLGGIAKGWIVEKAARLLNQYVDICGVSAGGDILFIGHPLDGMDWDVYLEDPRSPTETLARTSHLIRSGRDFLDYETQLGSRGKDTPPFDRSAHR